MPGDAQFIMDQSFYRAHWPGLGTSLMSRQAICILSILGFSHQQKPPVGGTHSLEQGRSEGGCKSVSDLFLAFLAVRGVSCSMVVPWSDL